MFAVLMAGTRAVRTSLMTVWRVCRGERRRGFGFGGSGRVVVRGVRGAVPMFGCVKIDTHKMYVSTCHMDSG